MEKRLLGRSGLLVPALSFGAMSFGGKGFFEQVGTSGVNEAQAIIDRCLDAGVNLFDTSNVYSFGQSEEILGQVLGKKRNRALIATKAFVRFGRDDNDGGCSRHHLLRACEASLKRLGTDHIDIYIMHNIDESTPLEETMRALDDLVRSGKVNYIGCSNYSGWHTMKAAAISAQSDLERYVVQQIAYSLVGREAELELIPVALDQGLGTMVWGPLAGGLLSGKFRRGQPEPEGARGAASGGFGKGDGGFMIPDRERVYDVVEAMDLIAKERNVPVSQVALNWLLGKRGVSTVLMGARNIEQLNANLGAAEWRLAHEEMVMLDKVSDYPLPYPYDHQQHYGRDRNPYWDSRNAQPAV